MQRNLNRANFPLIFLSFLPFSQQPNTNQDQKKIFENFFSLTNQRKDKKKKKKKEKKKKEQRECSRQLTERVFGILGVR